MPLEPVEDVPDNDVSERAKKVRPLEEASVTEVQSVTHTLRKDLPDAFDQAAASSGRFMKWLALIMLGVTALVVAVWLSYDYVWEGRSSVVDTPDVEPHPTATTPETIAVTVTSEPPGAAVAVNGVIALQRTPGEFDVVPNAMNTLGFYMDGFESKIIDIDIGDRAPSDQLSVALTQLVQPEGWVPPEPDPESDAPLITEWRPPTGRLNITTEPQGATILLNGRDICRSPCELETVAEQELHITARLNGYLDTATTAIAPTWDEERDTKYLSLPMRQPPASGQTYTYFEILGTPIGSWVRINDELVGRTQLNAPRRIDALQRIELEADEYEPWARTFYPSVGRFLVNPIMTRIRHGAAQLSLFIDTPGMETTSIYLGPNEIGVGLVELFAIDGGDYELTLSFTPPAETGERRRRSRVTVNLPPGIHVTERYVWDGTAFTLGERTEGPVVEVAQP